MDILRDLKIVLLDIFKLKKKYNALLFVVFMVLLTLVWTSSKSETLVYRTKCSYKTGICHVGEVKDGRITQPYAGNVFRIDDYKGFHIEMPPPIPFERHPKRRVSKLYFETERGKFLASPDYTGSIEETVMLIRDIKSFFSESYSEDLVIETIERKYTALENPRELPAQILMFGALAVFLNQVSHLYNSFPKRVKRFKLGLYWFKRDMKTLFKWGVRLKNKVWKLLKTIGATLFRNIK